MATPIGAAGFAVTARWFALEAQTSTWLYDLENSLHRADNHHRRYQTIPYCA